MRLKKSYTLRTRLVAFSLVAFAAGGIMTPIHAWYQEQRVLRQMPVTAQILQENDHFFG